MAWILDGVVLPDDLYWEDEFASPVVAQKIEHTVTGAIIVQEASKVTGRHVTLKGAVDRCWVLRSNILILQSWIDTVNKVMNLTFPDTTIHQVMFRHGGGSPMETRPLVEGHNEDAGTYRVLLTLQLVIVD